MTNGLVSFSQYARRRGLDVSTVSRAVSRGKLPVVVVDGRRRIDVAAADEARARDGEIQSGRGGKRDRTERRQAQWKAARETGFDPAVRAVLNVIHADWPHLLRDGMLRLGADEADAVRAIAILKELAGYLAVAVHDDLGSGVGDYRTVLEPFASPDWSATVDAAVEQVRADLDHMADNDDPLLRRMVDAARRAKP